MYEVQSSSAYGGEQPAVAQNISPSDLRDLALAAFLRTRMPMVVTNPRRSDNPIILANRAFMDLTGYSANEVIGRNCRFLQGADTDKSTLADLRIAIERDDDIVEVELLNYRKDGSSFVNALKINAIRNEDGKLLYHFASQMDITTERKTAELEASERRLLMEVDHRTLNALALVQSIVTLSKADNARGLSDAINRRIASLARTHRLLADRRWKSVNLADLVGTQLNSESADGRIEVNGDKAELLAHIAQPVGLVIHELVSNAQLHGALKDTDGYVSLNWSVEGDALVLQWREVVPTTEVASVNEGFGLQIVRSVIADQLGGKPSVDMRNNILEATLVIPSAIAKRG